MPITDVYLHMMHGPCQVRRRTASHAYNGATHYTREISPYH